MRKSLAFFGLIAVVLALSGCVTSPSPSATPAPTATPTTVPAPVISIGGVAIDPRGAPVYDARVALWQGEQLVGIQYTNEKGLFNFTNLQPAHYQITADIQGHQGMADQRFNESASVEIVIPDYTVASVTVVPSQSPTPQGMPHFEVARVGPTTVQVRLTSFGGVTTLKGFYVKSPAITTPELIAVDKPLGESWSATITDPNLRAPAHIVASSWVNGDYAVVVDATV